MGAKVAEGVCLARRKAGGRLESSASERLLDRLSEDRALELGRDAVHVKIVVGPLTDPVRPALPADRPESGPLVGPDGSRVVRDDAEEHVVETERVERVVERQS